MILLFTLSYPYSIGLENTFLNSEVSLLKEDFKDLILFPTLIEGEKYPLEPSINVNNNLGDYLKNNRSKLKYLFKFSFYNFFIIELFDNPKVLASSNRLKKLISFIINTLKVKEWIDRELNPFIIANKESNIILYTYWFTYITTSLCYTFEKTKNVKVITRAHGIDLFEYRNNNYLPLRNISIKKLSRFYFVSELGREYASKRYPQYINKYKTFPIGVVKQEIQNPATNTDVISLVSCSSVDKNKRVGLIYEALKTYSQKNPASKIMWTHLGNGPLFNDLERSIKEFSLNNLITDLKGFQSIDEILSFYRTKTINAFITLTSSEGGRPLSVQEALSFGIPVIATNVGGIPEIINDDNGFLLPENPTVDDINVAIRSVIIEKQTWNKKRALCYKTWEESCDAEKLTNDFITELKSL
jgi:glycosyltransferase involved in cell wall biosynthesis